MNTIRQKKGFTLIELLLVMAILGILITMGISTYVTSLQKGRDAKRKNDVRQMGVAVETYYADKGSYPVGANGLIVGCRTVPAQMNPTACAWGDPFYDAKTGTYYMMKLPQDSTATQQYYYVSDGTYYQIYTRLENTKDADIPKDGSNKSRVFTGTTCVSGSCSVKCNCNYGYASTNSTVTNNQTVGYE